MCEHKCPWVPEEGIGSRGAGVISGCERHEMGAGN